MAQEKKFHGKVSIVIWILAFHTVFVNLTNLSINLETAMLSSQRPTPLLKFTGNIPKCRATYNERGQSWLFSSGWQNLAAFRRGSKMAMKNFRQTRIYNFRDKCVVFERKRKFANLTK